MFRDLREYDGYRGTLNGLGVLELKAGSLGAAEEAFRGALSSAVDDDHEGDQARAKMNIGIVYQERGTPQGYEAAEAEYREALPLASASGEPELLGDVLFNLAQLLHYRVGNHWGTRKEASSAAEAYGRAGSMKESWARELIDEIENA